MSANSVAANGAGPIPAISMMRNPARGPIMVTFPLRLHAIAAPETLVAASAERVGVSQQQLCLHARRRRQQETGVRQACLHSETCQVAYELGCEQGPMPAWRGQPPQACVRRANARVRALHPHRRAWLGLLRRSRT